MDEIQFGCVDEWVNWMMWIVAFDSTSFDPTRSRGINRNSPPCFKKTLPELWFTETPIPSFVITALVWWFTPNWGTIRTKRADWRDIKGKGRQKEKNQSDKVEYTWPHYAHVCRPNWINLLNISHVALNVTSLAANWTTAEKGAFSGTVILTITKRERKTNQDQREKREEAKSGDR